MDHFRDAETLMAMADEAASKAVEAAKNDPFAALPGLAGSIVHLLAAQVHATLAIAAAMRRTEAADG